MREPSSGRSRSCPASGAPGISGAVEHADLGRATTEEGLEGPTLAVVVGVDPAGLVPDAGDVGGVDAASNGRKVTAMASVWPSSGRGTRRRIRRLVGSGRTDSPENSADRVEDRFGRAMIALCLSPRMNNASSVRSSRSSNRTPPSPNADTGSLVGARHARPGLILGLVITIGGLAVSFVVAFAGFVLVLVMAIMLESELRLLGRERRANADLGMVSGVAPTSTTTHR